MNLDDLLQTTNNLQAEINELNWNENDVRHSFYALFYSSVYQFYLGKSVFHLTYLISKQKVFFNEDVLYYEKHVKRLHEIPISPILARGYDGNLSRQIILGTWTTFELSVSLIFDYIVNEHEFNSLIKSMNAKLIKAMSSLEEENKELIMKILKKSSFVPLLRKFNFIVKQNKEAYGGNLNSDREFIEFLNRLRNCMVHSNGYYTGDNFTYNVFETVFEFRHKEIYLETGNNENVYFDISARIKEIFKNLSLCVSSIEFIPFPDDELNIA